MSTTSRHDASRRIEAALLTRLRAEHRVTKERAHQVIVDLVDATPRRALTL